MENIKINKLELENVKRVKAVKIEPTKDGFIVAEKLSLQGNCCYWFDEHDLTRLCNQKIFITTDGASVTARLKEGGHELKKAIAKCNPQDTFNFEVGAKLAFERLFTPTVKEVTRVAKIGEYVKIINPITIPKTNGVDDYKKGDILKIIDYKRGYVGTYPIYSYGVGSDNRHKALISKEYVVLEGYEPPKEEPMYYNGKVFCVKPRFGYTKGKIYEVKNGVIQTDNVGCTQQGFTSLDDLNGDNAEFIEVVE